MSVLDEPLSLSQLLDAEAFREVCRSFSDLYGIGIRVFDEQRRKLVDIRTSTADHCGYLFTVHPTKVMCTQLVNDVRACEVLPSGESKQLDCFSGLRYKVLPIVHEGDVLGRVIFGPYAPDGLDAPPKDLERFASRGLDLDLLGTYQSSIPRASEEAVRRVLENIRNVLDVIVHTGYKAYLTSQMHIVSITRAFEDLQNSNSTLKRANEKLLELDRLKSNFIATVSHELRTPLTSVIGYSEMLLEGMAGPLTEQQTDYLDTILEKGESLLTLIGQVLDLSRIESGNSLFHPGQCDPEEIVRVAITDVTPQALKLGVDIDVAVEEGVDPINVDGDKIRRVLTNLLANAVKFTPTGGRIIVRIDAVEHKPPGAEAYDVFEPARNRHLRLAVEDTGIGIPEEKIDRIFESFFQVDNSSTREFGGSGLGLSIARNFVRAHGGYIHVQSCLGAGSTFSVMLPYVTASPTGGAKVDGISGAPRAG